jgi:15-cis-phytoene synthase
MPDAFNHCAELVRTADRDRFLAALFAPAERRGALYALYAFNIEVARVREVAREPMPGEIRLQWWSEVLDGARSEEASANPVASALLTAIARHRLAPTNLMALIEARRFDLYDEPMASTSDLEAYARKTSSALIALAVQILAGTDAEAAPAAADPAGTAVAIAGLMRAFPLHIARRQLYVPVELLARHGVAPEDLFAGQSPAGLGAAFAELRNLARRHLRAAHEQVTALPREALPAFLPVALVRPSLDRLERCEPFAPVEISPWRRQWLIWRAARNPARIAA